MGGGILGASKDGSDLQLTRASPLRHLVSGTTSGDVWPPLWEVMGYPATREGTPELPFLRGDGGSKRTRRDKANHLTTMKDSIQGQGKGKGKNWSSPPASDDALATTGPYEGSDSRHCKGKCHHCQKKGHWARDCHTRKREEAIAAADQNAQAILSNPGTTSKPENKPVGSTNHIYLDNSDDDSFYMAEENIAHVYPDYAEPDPLMGKLEDDDINK